MIFWHESSAIKPGLPTVEPFPAGGYRFIVHQFQYSAGVAAEPGFRIERARFARPLPLVEGFDAIDAYLAGIGRSPTAFCACELRSPAQFTDAGFVAFNRGLGAFGQPGVERVLEILRRETRAAMQEVGTPSIKRLTPALVQRV
jgi:hypothetical protein